MNDSFWDVLFHCTEKKLYHSLEKATAPNTVWNIYTDKL